MTWLFSMSASPDRIPELTSTAMARSFVMHQLAYKYPAPHRTHRAIAKDDERYNEMSSIRYTSGDIHSIFMHKSIKLIRRRLGKEWEPYDNTRIVTQ